MRKKEKILILFIIICIIIALILGIILTKQKSKEKEEIHDENYDITNLEDATREIYFQDYKIIKNCLQTYVDTLNLNNSSYYGYDENRDYISIVNEADKKTNIYNLISKKYIKENNITIENIYNYIETTTENKIVIPTNIESKISNENIKSYGVSVLVMSMKNKKDYSNIYLIVNLDKTNNTFSIEPLKDINDREKTKVDITNIDKNNKNEYSEVTSTKEDIAKEYFSDCKNMLLSNYNLVYELLDEEYKNKRFKNIERFEEYVNKNYDMFKKTRIEEYKVYYNEDIFQYICVDQFKNVYIFNEKDVLDYSIILDSYTIDLKQFIEKYDEANTQEKVLLNIEKIKQAINSGDYEYIYSKLADSFKNENYKTKEEFETYISSALYNYITVDYKKFTNEGETYIYNIEISDLMDKNKDKINMQIIMQLKEKRDFVISFNIK